ALHQPRSIHCLEICSNPPNTRGKMTTDLKRETKTVDLFWGPFAELRSQLEQGPERTRFHELAKTTVLEALSTRIMSSEASRFQALAAQAKGPVLYFGCGTGLVLLRLAEDGHEIVGIDGSADVIEALRRRLASLPPEVQDRVKLVQTDLSRFEIEKTFPLVILPYFTFTLVAGWSEQQALLRQIARHLRPNGILAFNYPIYNPAQLGKDTVIDTDLLIEGQTVTGKIGWKRSRDLKHLIVNSSSHVPQTDGTT